MAHPAAAIDTHGGRGIRAIQPYAVPNQVDADNRQAACEHFGSPSCGGEPHEQLGRLLSLSCHAKRDAKKCNELEANIQDKSLLLDCNPDKICSSTTGDMSMRECVVNGVKISTEMLLAMNPVEISTDLYHGITHAYAAAASCYENKNGEKDKIMAAYEQMVDPRTPKWHIPPGMREAMLRNFSCAQMESQLNARFMSQQNDLRAQLQAHTLVPLQASHDKQKPATLAEAIERLQKQLGLPLQCYTPKAQAELACTMITTAILMTGLAVATGGATALAGRALSEKLVQYGASRAAAARVLDAVATGAKVNLEDAALLSDFGRGDSASKLLNRTLSATERDAVLKAHEVGSDVGAGFGTYTPEQLREKVQILKDAGFSQDERSALMRNGITGQAPSNAPTLALSQGEAKTRFASLQEKARPTRTLNDTEKYAREQETRMFENSMTTLADKTAPAADRMNAARMAAQQASSYGDTEMARSYGAIGVKEARAALTEAQVRQPGLTMDRFLAQKGSNFGPNYETAANMARDRNAVNEATAARMQRMTAEINKMPGPRASIQEVAVEKSAALDSDIGEVARRTTFQNLSTARQNEIILSFRREQLAILESSGVYDSSPAILRVKAKIQKLDPKYLEPKP